MTFGGCGSCWTPEALFDALRHSLPKDGEATVSDWRVLTDGRLHRCVLRRRADGTLEHTIDGVVFQPA